MEFVESNYFPKESYESIFLKGKNFLKLEYVLLNFNED